MFIVLFLGRCPWKISPYTLSGKLVLSLHWSCLGNHVENSRVQLTQSWSEDTHCVRVTWSSRSYTFSAASHFFCCRCNNLGRSPHSHLFSVFLTMKIFLIANKYFQKKGREPTCLYVHYVCVETAGG